MALKEKDLKQLGIATVKAHFSPKNSYSYGESSYSFDELDDLFRNELKEYNKMSTAEKEVVYSVMAASIDEYVPKKVLAQYSQFAEVKHFKQGETVEFIQRITEASKRRAKKYITKVGLAGQYEVFRLAGKKIDVKTSAFGGGAQISLEEYLDGKITMADVLEVLMEGLDEAIYIEIERALKAAVTKLGTHNKYSGNSFVESEMVKLLSVADSYGGKATIYCTQEFAATMLPADRYFSDNMKDTLWNTGHLGNFRGHNVVILEQSYEDETNAVKVIDPAYAYIVPGNKKPVKIAFEGNTIVRDYTNRDGSTEVMAYKKVGVYADITNDICVYINTSLKREDVE